MGLRRSWGYRVNKRSNPVNMRVYCTQAVGRLYETSYAYEPEASYMYERIDDVHSGMWPSMYNYIAMPLIGGGGSLGSYVVSVPLTNAER